MDSWFGSPLDAIGEGVEPHLRGQLIGDVGKNFVTEVEKTAKLVGKYTEAKTLRSHDICQGNIRLNIVFE